MNKSKRPVKRDLFLSTYGFFLGVFVVAMGLYLASTTYNMLPRPNSTWVVVMLTLASTVLIVVGLLLIAAGLFPKNRRLQSFAERFDGSAGELGCLIFVVTVPIYLVAKLLKHFLQDDNRR